MNNNSRVYSNRYDDNNIFTNESRESFQNSERNALEILFFSLLFLFE